MILLQETKDESNPQGSIYIDIYIDIDIDIDIDIYIYISTIYTGLEKLAFLVHESPCSSKQVQENIVHLVILCTL